MERVNIQMVCNGQDICIIVDGKVWDNWYYSEFDEGLGYEQTNMLDKLIFGDNTYGDE